MDSGSCISPAAEGHASDGPLVGGLLAVLSQDLGCVIQARKPREAIPPWTKPLNQVPLPPGWQNGQFEA